MGVCEGAGEASSCAEGDAQERRERDVKISAVRRAIFRFIINNLLEKSRGIGVCENIIRDMKKYVNNRTIKYVKI